MKTEKNLRPFIFTPFFFPLVGFFLQLALTGFWGIPNAISSVANVSNTEAENASHSQVASPLLAARNAECLSAFSDQALSTQLQNPPIILLFTAMHLMALGKDESEYSKALTLLSHSILEDLQLLAEGERFSKINEIGFERILVKLRIILGPIAYESAVGNVIASGTRAAQVLDIPSEPLNPRDRDIVSDLMEMRRKWGTKLLPENDPVFLESKYLTKRARLGGTSGIYLNSDYEREDLSQQIYKDWLNQLEVISGRNLKLVEFYLTGSDANNGLLEVATKAAERWEYLHFSQMGRKEPKQIKSAKILVFEGSYVAARGPLKNLNYLNAKRFKKSEWIIPGPHISAADLNDPAKQAEILEKENVALEYIRNQVNTSRQNDTEIPIGGVLIEPILGVLGVYEYRPEFMNNLRALCDELQVPIFADEILTGGGRTGKFFSFEHYPEFLPDFITIGKGLQVAGILYLNRKSKDYDNSGYSISLPAYVTLRQYAEPLLKSITVMERIRSGNLMQNAEHVGRYFTDKLREYFESTGKKGLMPEFRNKGLLIYLGLGAPLLSAELNYSLLEAGGRLMPYLSFSKENVDALLGKLNQSKAK